MFYRTFTVLTFIFSISLSAAVAVRAGDDAPGWLIQAAAKQSPVYEKNVPAVVLYDEQTVNVGADGQLIIATNYAVRLLNREGKQYAAAVELYLQSASKVREIKAWVIRPGGVVKSFGKENVIDRISSPNDIYDEHRLKIIDASDDADVGAVFGYQTVLEERPLFTQDKWEFQDNLPTLFSSYTLNLPAGWQAASVTFNHEDIKPQVSGTSYKWELRDLAPIALEADSPQFHALAPRINVNYSPTGAASSSNVYNSWQDVSQWYTDLSEPSVTVDDAIAGKARELIVNAQTEFEKIRAIGNFVQNLQYISVDIGVSRGGGHRPRPANVVLQHGYGDCKDKANLMRAMLRSLKIEAYPVLIFAGDSTYVRREWASPRQFNHCIIAIKVAAETNAPTVIKDERLGRLLIFDATDPYTLLGDLPDHEQGSWALIAAKKDGGIVQMPILPASSSRLERTAEATLMPDGSLQGTIKEQAFGQTASFYRARSRMLSAVDFKTEMESWLTRRVTGAKVSKLAPTDYPAEGRFDLNLDFAANNYAQIMQGSLMVFKPAFVGRLDSLTVTDGKRLNPILLDSNEYSEVIKVKLPDGFIVDEMPEQSKLETAFGKYAVSYQTKDGYLWLNRTLTLSRSTIPADKYAGVKDFFALVHATEQNPVVLIKK